MTAPLSNHAALRAIALALVVAFAVACSPSAPTTPPEGSAEREAIFTALRERRDPPEQTFTVRDLKVQGSWAWITADPASKDGTQHYETESWLLQKTGDAWKVVSQPCAEEGCELKAEVARMRKEHPDAPEAIFPK
jgi:hypothetical protein